MATCSRIKSKYVCAKCGVSIEHRYGVGENAVYKHNGSWSQKPCSGLPEPVLRTEHEKKQ